VYTRSVHLLQGGIVEISAKELRGKPGQIIEQAARGTEIVITIRGEKKARLIPYEPKAPERASGELKDEIFGLWEDRDDLASVEEMVRRMRKRRTI
jgi:prevent-host-death family protein